MLYASPMHQPLRGVPSKQNKNKQQRETMPNKKRTPIYTNIGTYVRAFHMLARSIIRQHKATLLKTIDPIQQTHRSNSRTVLEKKEAQHSSHYTKLHRYIAQFLWAVVQQAHDVSWVGTTSIRPYSSIHLVNKTTRQGKQIRYCFFWFLMSGTLGGRTRCNLLDIPNSRHAVSFDGVPLMPCAWTVGHLFLRTNSVNDLLHTGQIYFVTYDLHHKPEVT
jgi:hypothetical protein